MYRRVACVAAASALLTSACSLPFVDSPPQYGFISVSDDGEQLVPGSSDVPPTLDLRLHADVPFRQQDVSGTVDGTSLRFTESGGDLVASTAPFALATSHHLNVTVAGRAQGISLDFSIISPTAAMLAAHVDPAAGLVVDGAFDDPPIQAAVGAALPGARVSWSDATHLRATWPGAHPAVVALPAALATARGSHLASAVNLDLTGLEPGSLRRATVPAAPAVSGSNVVAFVVDSAASNTSLAHHQSVLTSVTATGWVANPDGSLSGTPDPPAVSRARDVRLPLWADLENDFQDPAGTTSLLTSASAVSALVSTVVQSVGDAGFAGVNLDFEGMPGGDKAAYTQFVKTLAAALHAHGSQLMVDVVPHGSGGVNEFSAAYDVPALGAAADVVDVMTYDEHGEGGSPGPVAGLDWDVAELAATLPGLNPQHTLLGIPLYGRTWSNGTGASASYSEVLDRLNDSGAIVNYDFAAQTPFIQSADGSTLTYFDDADSLARKIALAHQDGLLGIAAWRLGFEDPAFWTLFG